MSSFGNRFSTMGLRLCMFDPLLTSQCGSLVLWATFFYYVSFCCGILEWFQLIWHHPTLFTSNFISPMEVFLKQWARAVCPCFYKGYKRNPQNWCFVIFSIEKSINFDIIKLEVTLYRINSKEILELLS